MRRPLIRGKDFQTSIGKKNKFKKGSWEAYQKGSALLWVFSGGKEENECVRKKNSYYV
jgi:hypothetical protein